MSQTIRIHTHIGQDGMLHLHVPLGAGEAGAEVVVAIRHLSPVDSRPTLDRADWHRFVAETYGSCAGLGLERQSQGEPVKREAIE